MQGQFIQMFAEVFDFFFFILPIAIPIMLIWAGIDLYIAYKRRKYRNGLKWVLLEIFPPAEVTRSPASMEVFLLSLHQTGGESTWWDKYVDGKFRSRFSLELISQEGRIRYFIRTEQKHRAVVEAGLYAQYPGIEISEAEDYTNGYYYDPDKFDLFGMELELVKDDPYPIKTYVDYELDQTEKDEFKVDPMSPILEFLETIKPNNQMWFQIIVKAHKKEDLDFSKVFPSLSKKKDLWDEKGKEEIERIRGESFLEITDNGENKRKSTQQTPGQKNVLAALGRSLSKYSFDVGIRCIAISKKGELDPGNKAMKGIWKQYSSLDLNGFKPGYSTEFDWWYEDPFSTRLGKMEKEMLQSYKERVYFWKERPSLFWGFLFLGAKPRKKMVLNTEELATIYHFLGKVSEAPSVSKVDARKAAPPSNLPM
jgi:hypothetical protein